MPCYRRVLAAVFVLGSTGCPLFSSSVETPCTDDVVGCGEGAAFELDADCELTEPLRVTLGNGDGTFSAVLPGELPDVIAGVQGGQHLVLGLRFDNADPAHSVFEVELEARLGSASEDVQVGHREVVFGEEAVTIDGNNAEILDIVLLLDAWDTNVERRLTATIRDTCGREAVLEHFAAAD